MSDRLYRLLLSIGFGVMASLLLWRLGFFLFDTHRAIVYPFELDYGEGIVWQQAVMMIEGRAYGDINQYPFIVFHYPPVYHMLALATAALTGLNQLTAGRMLELIATLITSLIVGGIVWSLTIARTKDRGHALLCGGTAALVVISFVPVHAWAPLMRVDMVALAFSFAGLLFALRSVERPSQIHLAVLCFVLAVYTRQTMLAAPIACFLVLVFARPRTALHGIISGMALGLVPLVILSVATDGQFLKHILSYNVNRYNFSRLGKLSGLFQTYSFYLLIGFYALISMIGIIRAEQKGNPDNEPKSLSSLDVRFRIIITYFFLVSLSLLLVGKSGSNVNYMTEWCCALAILVGVALPPLRISEQNKGFDRLGAAVLAVPFLIALQNYVGPWADYADNIVRPPSFGARYHLLAEAKRASKPILSDDMVMLMQAGKQVPWESAIFAELASQHRWDQRPILQMIEQRKFAFIFTHGGRGTVFYNDRYSPPVADAIDHEYPVKQQFGQFVIHRPVVN